MELDNESIHALLMFRALPPEYQEIAVLLLKELRQKIAQINECSLEKGETG